MYLKGEGEKSGGVCDLFPTNRRGKGRKKKKGRKREGTSRWAPGPSGPQSTKEERRKEGGAPGSGLHALSASEEGKKKK